jgi:hypothetical protein
MHQYDGEAHVHAGESLDGLSREVVEFLDGRSAPMSEFHFGEFRDDSGSRMLMIVEYC